jgi:hypothetical protein
MQQSADPYQQQQQQGWYEWWHGPGSQQYQPDSPRSEPGVYFSHQNSRQARQRVAAGSTSQHAWQYNPDGGTYSQDAPAMYQPAWQSEGGAPVMTVNPLAVPGAEEVNPLGFDQAGQYELGFDQPYGGPEDYQGSMGAGWPGPAAAAAAAAAGGGGVDPRQWSRHPSRQQRQLVPGHPPGYQQPLQQQQQLQGLPAGQSSRRGTHTRTHSRSSTPSSVEFQQGYYQGLQDAQRLLLMQQPGPAVLGTEPSWPTGGVTGEPLQPHPGAGPVQASYPVGSGAGDWGTAGVTRQSPHLRPQSHPDSGGTSGTSSPAKGNFPAPGAAAGDTGDAATLAASASRGRDSSNMANAIAAVATAAAAAAAIASKLAASVTDMADASEVVEAAGKGLAQRAASLAGEASRWSSSGGAAGITGQRSAGGVSSPGFGATGSRSTAGGREAWGAGPASTQRQASSSKPAANGSQSGSTPMASSSRPKGPDSSSTSGAAGSLPASRWPGGTQQAPQATLGSPQDAGTAAQAGAAAAVHPGSIEWSWVRTEGEGQAPLSVTQETATSDDDGVSE